MAATFSPTREQLCTLRDQIHDAIRDGLEKPDQQVKALPAYLRKPDADISGEAVVLDVGGTNMRSACVALGGAPRLLAGGDGNVLHQSDIMQRATKTGAVSAKEFFAAQADLIVAASPREEIALGYCFSYPASIAPDGGATLLRWTKGIEIADVKGVSGPLIAALKKRGKRVRTMSTLNDTVASLLAGVYLAPRFTQHIGLIAGTGSNMAGFFRVADIPKLAPDTRWHGDGTMAVNLESGNFGPGNLLTEWDDAVDAMSPPEQRGRQRFEKAVSGAYLPWLLWFAAGEAACRAAHFDPRDPQTNAGTVAALRDDENVGATATAIIDRSADFVAAALAGLITLYARHKTDVRAGVLAEGTLFWKTPFYAPRVMETLNHLLPETAKAELIDKPAPGASAQAIDPNLIGAATAALSQKP